jgi:hypothetical protein
MSTQIKNVDGLSVQEIRDMVHQGGKFVVFPYTISIVVMTFKRSSDIYFVKPGESGIKHGVGFLFANLLLGWWGIPWGPIYTIGSLVHHIGGGKNVTPEIMNHIAQRAGSSQPTPNTNSSGQSNQGYNIPGNGSNNTQQGSSAYNIPR